MTQESFSFVVYLIHACADRWNISPGKVYRALQKSGCLEKYLIPHYEILHTQSTQYLVEDIAEYLKNRQVGL